MNSIPFFDFGSRNRDIRQEVLKTFEYFFDSKWYVLGNFTTKFEAAYASYNHTKYAVGVSTGLDALHLSLRVLNIGSGDEVIVPSNTYIATVLSISYTGAQPVFVEPRMETANLDPELIEAAVTERTKCIMPVHLYGQACEMDQIMEIAKRHDLFVVEDNAQAHGASYNGKLTGSFGNLNATSFYPTKNLGALGEAGAVTTDNEAYANLIQVLRNYGSRERYHNEIIGYNNRIDEFEAAYLTIALKHIDKWTAERNQIADLYRKQLADVKGITLLEDAVGATNVNHLFVIRTKKRDELREHLQKQGIGTQIHYPIPPHLQQAYRDLNFKTGDFPIAEELAATSLSLPIWPGLNKDQISYICNSIEQFANA